MAKSETTANEAHYSRAYIEVTNQRIGLLVYGLFHNIL